MYKGRLVQGGGGGVTPIDSIVTTATAVVQWSMVKRVRSMVKTCAKVRRFTANSKSRQGYCEVEVSAVDSRTTEKGRSRS